MPSTVLAALPMTLLGALASLGHDADGVRTRAGVPAEALFDPDGRIPFASHARLWEEIAALGGDVGLALGERLGTAALGIVGHAMAQSETVGEAWSCMERYRRLVLDDAIPKLRVVEGEARLVQPLPPRFARLRHPAETQATATITILRGVAGERFSARRVAFQHAAPADTARHRAIFGVDRIEWGAPLNELVIDAAILDRHNARADPALRAYLVGRADRLMAELGEDDRVADRVRREIVAELPNGEPSAASIAKRLGASERTLHRHLKREGTNLRAILDDARRERSVSLLADRARRIGEIAYLLGYRDATTFARAFRRWTGESPDAWRKRPA